MKYSESTSIKVVVLTSTVIELCELFRHVCRLTDQINSCRAAVAVLISALTEQLRLRLEESD